MTWFDVDREGLGKLVERRGKQALLFELIQNAWDTDTERVDVALEPVPGRPLATLRVEDDDPTGFADLSHAFTLFSESAKGRDADKRGRFNLGEKLVLALCTEATIASTTGEVRFTEAGERHVHPRRRRPRGSLFTATVRMTRHEIEAVLAACRTLLPPPGVVTVVNGAPIDVRTPIASFAATLPTEIADDEGVLRPTRRRTDVHVHEPAAGEVPTLYELGIPVVGTGDRFHVDVQQKVPLNVERDNVTPAYLQTIRTEVLNATAELLTAEEATDDWVTAASGDERADDAAVETVLGHRYGPRRVAFDPSDPEANHRAVADGYTLVHGGGLSAGQWANARRIGTTPPAGRVTPTPTAYDADGRPERVVEPADHGPGMQRVVAFARRLAAEVLEREVDVLVVREPHVRWTANYAPGRLCLNVGRLGRRWFERPTRQRIVDLLVHEFGHEYEANHLSTAYHDALTRIAARCVEFALREPEAFAFDA